MIKVGKELRQNKNYAKYMKLLGWKVERLSDNFVYSKKIPILGWFAKIQRPGKLINQKEFSKFFEGRRMFLLQLEPLTTTQAAYYKQMINLKNLKTPSLPTKTLVFDLTRSEDDLLKGMHYKTRYNIKIAEKFGVKINESRKIELFAKFWTECALKRGMFLPLQKEIKAIWNAFGREAMVFFAYVDKKIAGGVLLVSTKTTTYYMYAAANEMGKKAYAPTLLVWEAIKYAKSRNKKAFDFEGIYDDRFPLKSWVGFSRFKKSFGGKEVVYPGMLQKFVFPFKRYWGNI